MENNRKIICAVCGVKNSGKTTLIGKLIGELSRRGIRTAVIKHDGHDFACDVPGTDSFRFNEAGAFGTAVFSRNRIFVHRRTVDKDAPDGEMLPVDHALWEQRMVQELSEFFPEADVILVEGLKNTVLPKIEVIRSEISEQPVSNPSGRFLIVSDRPEKNFAEKVLGLSQIDKIVDNIVDYFSVKSDGE